ncbi:MAG: hypothetical protein JWM64_1495 [Frankiales bacterium]|nr:hypothetical protein [Frankiales bacterium]
MRTSGTTTSDVLPDAAVLLADVARAAASGPAAALAALVDALGLRSAVVRGPDAALLAVAGSAVDAVPVSRQAPVPVACDLEVPGTGSVLTVVGAPDGALPLLTAAAAVLALSLRPATGPALLADGDAELDALADALHDGPVQVLVAARYACDAAVRGGDASLARDGVQEALVGLRRTMWHLRPRTAACLPDALEALSERLVEAGGAPLVLDVAAAADLAPAPRALAYRLVQAVADGGPLSVTAARDRDGVVVALSGGRPLPDPDRWGRRCRLLAAALVPTPDGLRLHLPPPLTDDSLTPSEAKACS